VSRRFNVLSGYIAGHITIIEPEVAGFTVEIIRNLHMNTEITFDVDNTAL